MQCSITSGKSRQCSGLHATASSSHSATTRTVFLSALMALAPVPAHLSCHQVPWLTAAASYLSQQALNACSRCMQYKEAVHALHTCSTYAHCIHAGQVVHIRNTYMQYRLHITILHTCSTYPRSRQWHTARMVLFACSKGDTVSQYMHTNDCPSMTLGG